MSSASFIESQPIPVNDELGTLSSPRGHQGIDIPHGGNLGTVALQEAHHKSQVEPLGPAQYNEICLVEDTQFVELERDTQAPRECGSDSSPPRRTSQTTDRSQSNVPFTRESNFDGHIFQYPVVDTANSDPPFKFSTAPKQPAGHFGRPPPRNDMRTDNSQTKRATQNNDHQATVEFKEAVADPSTTIPENSTDHVSAQSKSSIAGFSPIISNQHLDKLQIQHSPSWEILDPLKLASNNARPASFSSVIPTKSVQRPLNNIYAKPAAESHRRIKKPFPNLSGSQHTQQSNNKVSKFITQHKTSLYLHAALADPTQEYVGGLPNTGSIRISSPVEDENSSLRHLRSSPATAEGNPNYCQFNTVGVQGKNFKVARTAHLLGGENVSTLYIGETQQIASNALPCLSDPQDCPIHILDTMVDGHDGTNGKEDQMTTDLMRGKTSILSESAQEFGHRIEHSSSPFEKISDFQSAARVLSRAESEGQRRPHPQPGNHRKAISRPIHRQELHSYPVPVSNIVKEDRVSKVKKPNGLQSRKAAVSQTSSPDIVGQQQHSKTKVSKGFQDFLTNAEKYWAIIEEHETQKEILEVQRAELKELRQSRDLALETIKSLTDDKAALSRKLERFTDLSSKYRSHMNEVVKSQKYLKSEAIGINEKAEEALKALRDQKEMDDSRDVEVDANQKTTLKKIEAAVASVKNVANEVSKHNQELESTNQNLVAEKGQLESANGILIAHQKELEGQNAKLQEETQKFEIVKEQLISENSHLLSKIQGVKKTNLVLEADLQKRLCESQCDKKSLRQLEKSLYGQNAVYNELKEQLRKAPSEVAEVLSKEGGILVKILSSEKAIEARIGEATNIINDMKKYELEPPISLVKLVEDLLLRLEKKIEDSTEKGQIVQKSGTKLIEDLKKSLNKLLLDQDSDIRLKDRIDELIQANRILEADNNACNQELLCNRKQLEEAKHDLASSRDQMGAKLDTLAATIAAPLVDPMLHERIQDLETLNRTLSNQLEVVNQDILNAREELRLSRKSADDKGQLVKTLEKQLNDFQMMVKALTEEKDKYTMNKKKELAESYESGRQSVAKAAEKTKADLQKKSESVLHGLEKRLQEKEAELYIAEEDLKKMRDRENDRRNDSQSLQTELSVYEERCTQYVASLERLEKQNLSKDTFEGLENSVQIARNEFAELKNYFHSVCGEFAQSIDAATRRQIDIEKQLLNSDTSEREGIILLEEDISLPMQLGSLSGAHKPSTLQGEDPTKDRTSAAGTSKPQEKSMALSAPQVPSLVTIAQTGQQDQNLSRQRSRVVNRRSNNLGSSMINDATLEPSPFNGILGIQPTASPPAALQTPAVRSLIPDTSPTVHSTSPLTDIEPMVDELDSIVDGKQLLEQYEKTRSIKHRAGNLPATATTSLAVSLVTRNLTSGVGGHQNSYRAAPSKVIAAASPTSLPDMSFQFPGPKSLKSALKKSVKPSGQTIREIDPVRGTSVAFESQIDMAPTQILSSSSGVNKNLRQLQQPRTGSYNRVASGKSAKSIGTNEAQKFSQGLSRLSQVSPPVQQPPISEEPRRNKRQASSYASSSRLVKAPRTVTQQQASSRTFVAESQEETYRH